MRELIYKLRFWLAEKIGGPNMPQHGPTASFRLSVVTPTLRPTTIPVPKDAPYRHDKLNREEFGTGLCKLLSFGDNTGAIFLTESGAPGKRPF